MNNPSVTLDTYSNKRLNKHDQSINEHQNADHRIHINNNINTNNNNDNSNIININNIAKRNTSLSNQQQPQQLNEIKILCFNLTQYNQTTQFLLCCLGVFVLYIVYGYMQELIFTLDGFKPYGWFLTLIQFGYYTGFGYFERKFERNRTGIKLDRLIPIRTYVLLAFLTLGTMGLSNSSLGYLNYPTQVIFKCCKLVPVLIGSMVIQRKSHGPFDFLAAISMCVGLTMFTLVDSQISPNFNTIGVTMISTALLFDAAIGNVQEKAMREYKAPNNEVVFYSYGIGFIYLFIIMLLTGNLVNGIEFCGIYPIQTYGFAFLFSLSGYLGMQFVLTLVRTCGAPLAATVTTARKAVTIGLSFIFFTKPFSIQYLWSGIIVVIGIYLNVYSKRNKLTFKELFIKLKESLTTSSKRYSMLKNLDKQKILLDV